jgi:hypothetical protein
VLGSLTCCVNCTVGGSSSDAAVCGVQQACVGRCWAAAWTRPCWRINAPSWLQIPTAVCSQQQQQWQYTIGSWWQCKGTPCCYQHSLIIAQHSSVVHRQTFGFLCNSNTYWCWFMPLCGVCSCQGAGGCAVLSLAALSAAADVPAETGCSAGHGLMHGAEFCPAVFIALLQMQPAVNCCPAGTSNTTAGRHRCTVRLADRLLVAKMRPHHKDCVFLQTTRVCNP